MSIIRLQDLLSEVAIMLPWRNSRQSSRPMAVEMESSVDPVLGPNVTHMAPRRDKLTEYRGATIKFELIHRGRAEHRYKATLMDGKWPKDEDLITLADGGDPAHDGHFGGGVRRTNRAPENTKSVTVNVD